MPSTKGLAVDDKPLRRVFICREKEKKEKKKYLCIRRKRLPKIKPYGAAATGTHDDDDDDDDDWPFTLRNLFFKKLFLSFIGEP